jgi:hypothetical protein
MRAGSERTAQVGEESRPDLPAEEPPSAAITSIPVEAMRMEASAPKLPAPLGAIAGAAGMNTLGVRR